MNIFQIVSVGIIATIISITLRKHHPELSILIGIASGIIIFIAVLQKFTHSLDLVSRLMKQSRVGDVYMANLLKVIGTSYVAEFASQICKDAGEEAIAKKVELGGKIIIMNLAIPLLITIMEIVTGIVNNI